MSPGKPSDLLPLSPLQRYLIRRSFGTIAMHRNPIVTRWHTLILRHNPELRPLLPPNTTEQRRKAAGVLALLVKSLDEPAKQRKVLNLMPCREIAQQQRLPLLGTLYVALITTPPQPLGTAAEDAWMHLCMALITWDAPRSAAAEVNAAAS